MKHKNKFVMTTQLLVDSQGNKIGKTERNAIALAMPPNDIFSAIMNFPDEVITKSLEYLTDIPPEEIKEIETEIQKGTNPMQFKKKLAFEVVSQLNSNQAAQKALEEFERVVQSHMLPMNIPMTRSSGATISEALIDSGLSGSISESKRLIQQGAVSGTTTPEVPFEKITDPKQPFKENIIVKKGITIVKIEKDKRNEII